MKKRVYVVLLSLLLLDIAAFAANISGGVGDGGGGGVIPVTPVTQKEVESHAKFSKMMLIGYLQAREITYYQNLKDKKPNSSLDQKLFAPIKSILQVINDIKMDLKSASACLDQNGVAVDGSVYGRTPDSICISSFRLTPKLDSNSFQHQVPALVLHELSHHMGTTEAEAEELQNDFVIKNFRKPRESYRNLDTPLSGLGQAWQAMQLLSSDIFKGEFSCERTDFYVHTIHGLKVNSSLGVWSGELSWINAWDFDRYMYAAVKANAVKELVCSWDKSLSAAKIAEHHERYLSGFVGPGPYLAENYITWGGVTWKNLGLVQVPMKKCDSQKCVESEVADLHSTMLQLLVAVQKIADSSYFTLL